MRISPLFWNVAYLQQLTLEHFGGKETMLTEFCSIHTKYFIKTKETQEYERNLSNERNLSLCLLVSPVKWSATSLSLCVLKTWSAWHLDDQASLYENSKRSYCSCQGKNMLHTFGKRCVGCFWIEASCITLVSPGRWESHVHCRFSQFPSKSLEIICVVSFHFLTVKMSSTEIDALTLFVYTTCPSLAKAGEINIWTQADTAAYFLANLRRCNCWSKAARYWQQLCPQNGRISGDNTSWIWAKFYMIQSYKRLTTSKSSTAPMNLLNCRLQRTCGHGKSTVLFLSQRLDVAGRLCTFKRGQKGDIFEPEHLTTRREGLCC